MDIDIQTWRRISAECPNNTFANLSQSKAISFKSICPSPQTTMKKVALRQQHSVVFTKSPNKSQLEEFAKIKELKKKVQQLQGKLKSKVEEQKKIETKQF